MPQAISIEGIFDRGKLENGFKALIKRHETLRTSFRMVDGEVVQKVHREVDFQINYVETGDGEIKESELIKPFDLSKAPLLRVTLLKLGKEKHILLFDMHHIISDGASLTILVRELVLLYNGEKLPELRIQYKDFSAWHNELLKSDMIKKQEEYWLNLFKGKIALLDLPTDYPRPNIMEYEADAIDFEINETITQKLNEFSVKNEATLFITMLTTYNVLLALITGQEDIIVGSPAQGRRHTDLENIVGMFIEMVVFRNRPKLTRTFTEFFKEVKENTLKAFENQDYQFEMLLEKLQIRKDLSRNPLFDTMLNFLNFSEQNNDPRMMYLGDTKITPIS